MLVQLDSERKKAVLLCVLLGTFGAHRFYMHQKYRGLSYLLFSWTLVPSVLSVIDAAFLIKMSDVEFNEERSDDEPPSSLAA